MLQELDGHLSYVNTLTFDDEGLRLFLADSAGQIHFWNMQFERPVYSKLYLVHTLYISMFQLLQELDGHLSYVNPLTVDDEGLRLFSADSAGQIRVWNMQLERPVYSTLYNINTLYIKSLIIWTPCIFNISVTTRGRRSSQLCQHTYF